MTYLAVTTLAALVFGAAHARPPAQPKLMTIIPSVAEPGIDTTYDAANYVGDPVGRATGKLFVFLPGTNGAPISFQDIVEDAVERGYNAIGLEYPNSPSVHDLCVTSNDKTCPGVVREEVITGRHPNPYVKVDPLDSIDGRLTSLIGYLAKHDPSGGWSQYVSGGSLVLSKIVFSGHSQGGGDAAYIGKLASTAGLCEFDAPGDTDPTSDPNNPSPAMWLSQANITPTSREFGVTNTLDQIALYALILPNWNTIPIPSQNQLTVTRKGTSKDNSHELTVADGATPIVNGSPLYLPLWNQACLSF